MSRKFRDPFGGVHGEEPGNSPSPFKIDKEEALREIKDSLDKWDQKKVVKKSFLQKLRQGKASDEELAKANDQLAENFKNLGLGVLVILPFSPITIPYIFKKAQEYKVDIVPKWYKDITNKND